jgi:cytochrome P450
MHTTRSTKTAQVLTKGSATYVVPANALVYINNSALHTNPKTWGSDSLTFRPTRWLFQDSTAEDVFVTMPRGQFIPWSGGPRVCPGQKMSQVEFVAVIATIFKRYRVAAIPEKDETMENAKQRLQEVMNDSQPRLTLQMNKPQDVKLKWSKR